MAKLTMMVGKATGKVGGIVYAVRYGQQIAREYNPNPAKSSTEGQVAARAKLKLMSQLAMVVSPVIAMQREGAVSPRNAFVRENYPLTGFSEGEATIDLASVKLTKSVIALPSVGATLTGTTLTASLGVPSPSLDMMVYAVFQKESDGRLRYVTAVTNSEAGADGLYSTEVALRSTRETLVLAYGIRIIDEKQMVKYGELTTLPAEAIAKLIVTTSVVDEAMQLTETRGVIATVA